MGFIVAISIYLNHCTLHILITWLPFPVCTHAPHWSPSLPHSLSSTFPSLFKYLNVDSASEGESIWFSFLCFFFCVCFSFLFSVFIFLFFYLITIFVARPYLWILPLLTKPLLLSCYMYHVSHDKYVWHLSFWVWFSLLNVMISSFTNFSENKIFSQNY